MRQEKSSWESITDVEKLRYSILPTVEVHTLRIGKLLPDLYSSDKEDNFIILNTPLDVSVSTTCFSQDKSSTSTLAKELIKRILYKRIEKEDGNATPKNVQFGE